MNASENKDDPSGTAGFSAEWVGNVQSPQLFLLWTNSWFEKTVLPLSFSYCRNCTSLSFILCHASMILLIMRGVPVDSCGWAVTAVYCNFFTLLFRFYTFQFNFLKNSNYTSILFSYNLHTFLKHVHNLKAALTEK